MVAALARSCFSVLRLLEFVVDQSMETLALSIIMRKTEMASIPVEISPTDKVGDTALGTINTVCVKSQE